MVGNIPVKESWLNIENDSKMTNNSNYPRRLTTPDRNLSFAWASMGLEAK